MKNGRCVYHGGKTPKGDGWHRPAWPNGDAPDFEDKLNRKLRDQKRTAKKRAARLAAMPSDERERYAAWQRSHRPGKAAMRAQRRREIAQARDAAALLARKQPTNPAVEALQSEIDALRERLSAMEGAAPGDYQPVVDRPSDFDIFQ